MKKYVLDLKVVSVEALSDKHVLIKLTDEKPLPEILPGQFVEVRVDHSPTTMLRRPISISATASPCLPRRARNICS